MSNKTIKTTRGRVLLIAAAAVLLFGCAYGPYGPGLTYTGGGALLGTLYGAGLGAAIGSATGHAGEGAGIGALAGTIVGGLLGYTTEYNDRYGYYDPSYDDSYYNNSYYGDSYYNDRYYRRGCDNRPPSGYEPNYGYDPGYGYRQDYGNGPAPEERYPSGNEGAYSGNDTGPSTPSTTPYSEDYYQKQNRRLMSPGYNGQ